MAAALFERLGYAIVERNYRTREGEIDLIAARGATIVFCEVKALVARYGAPSAGPATPLEAVGPAKQRQVRRIARSWIAAGGRPGTRNIRFDVVAITLSPSGSVVSLDHLEGAF